MFCTKTLKNIIVTGKVLSKFNNWQVHAVKSLTNILKSISHANRIENKLKKIQVFLSFEVEMF